MLFWPALLVAASMGAADPSAGQLALAIVDQNGAALGGVEISVTGAAARQTTTDDAGAAIFPDLPAGSYRLSARRSGSVSESREVIIRAGTATDLTIEFRLDWPIDPGTGKAVRDTITVRCDPSSRRSLERSWSAADAVARIHIDTQAVYDHWKLRDDRFPIVTVHHARVVELLKPHSLLPAATATLTLLQEGGVIERADLIEKASALGSKLLETSREYVVFLRWSDQWREWTFTGCDLGAIEIAGDVDERLAILRTIKN